MSKSRFFLRGGESAIVSRGVFVLLHDCIAAVLAWVGAFWLRFNLVVPDDVWSSMLHVGMWVIPIQTLVFSSFGLYRGIWRYASLHDLKRILGAVAIAGLAIPLVLFLARGQSQIPRSVLLIDPILLVLIMGGSRLAYRTWREYQQFGVMHKQGDPVLVLGAGDAAVTLAKELARSAHWRVVGFLDDSSEKVGRFLHGIKVLGTIDEAQAWAKTLDVKQAIIAMPSASLDLRRRAVSIGVRRVEPDRGPRRGLPRPGRGAAAALLRGPRRGAPRGGMGGALPLVHAEPVVRRRRARRRPARRESTGELRGQPRCVPPLRTAAD